MNNSDIAIYRNTRLRMYQLLYKLDIISRSELLDIYTTIWGAI